MRKWILAAIISLPAMSFACTDILLKSQDNAVVVGRSMEFAAVLPTQIQIFPANQQFSSSDANGISWTSKYPYIGFVYTPARIVMDGFNERGLSIGALWLPGTEYPTATNAKNNLFFADVSAWLLGNFATVDEVKQALESVNIYAGPVKGFSSIPPIHLSIHDLSGHSLVLEFSRGQMKLYDNKIGVLTNAPEFPWHETNIRNFLNLKALNVGKIDIDGTVLEPTGQGSGLLGIPGDWTPPSRFVRAAIFKEAIMPPKNAPEAVIAAIHLLNTVDIPYGAIRSANNEGSDYTQWIAVKDLTNKILHFRTYRDQNIHSVALNDAKVMAQPIVLDVNP